MKIIPLFLIILIFFSIFIINTKANPDTLNLAVNAFSNRLTGWTKTGSSPYLGVIDYPTNLITHGHTGTLLTTGDYGFLYTSQTGTISKVELYLYRRWVSYPLYDAVDYYMQNDGSNWVKIGSADYSQGWSNQIIDVTTKFTSTWTWLKINATIIYFSYIYNAGKKMSILADSFQVDESHLKITYSTAQIYTYNFSDTSKATEAITTKYYLRYTFMDISKATELLNSKFNFIYSFLDTGKTIESLNYYSSFLFNFIDISKSIETINKKIELSNISQNKQSTIGSLALRGLYPTPDTYSVAGQRFIINDKEYYLNKVSFKLNKVGNPTGLAYAKLYNMSGNPLLPETLLTTSDSFEISNLTTTATYYNFTFSEPYHLSLNTWYAVLFFNPSSGLVNNLNYVRVTYSNYISGYYVYEWYNYWVEISGSCTLNYVLYGSTQNRDFPIFYLVFPFLDISKSREFLFTNIPTIGEFTFILWLLLGIALTVLMLAYYSIKRKN